MLVRSCCLSFLWYRRWYRRDGVSVPIWPKCQIGTLTPSLLYHLGQIGTLTPSLLYHSSLFSPP
ncbi:MAG: hypothetical protein FWE41_01945 [Coriobacteriia bacterium]|nr:hypothetical protein [Coriobacteriia bacterium]MCL2750232.1 hypothetical protein [Coriobacteriia bacterium]